MYDRYISIQTLIFMLLCNITFLYIVHKEACNGLPVQNVDIFNLNDSLGIIMRRQLPNRGIPGHSLIGSLCL